MTHFLLLSMILRKTKKNKRKTKFNHIILGVVVSSKIDDVSNNPNRNRRVLRRKTQISIIDVNLRI